MNGKNAEHSTALMVLLLGAVCIAFAPIFVRLSELGPVATAFFRLFFSLPVLWFWLGLERKNYPETTPVQWQQYISLLLAGFFFACDLACWHWSIRLTSVANATLLANFAPIFVTLGSWLIFRERFSRSFLFGMVCAITGVIVLLGESISISYRHFAGDILGITTAVFYAAYILSVGRLRTRFSTAMIMAWSGLSACIVLFLVTVLAGENFMAITVSGWLVLIGLALLSHVGGQSMIAYALAHLSAAFSSVGLLLQPALAAVFAWILFQEALSPVQLLGAVIVLIGVYFARRGSTVNRCPVEE